MARNPEDATRFTSTPPHAHSKSPVKATTIPLSSGAPPNETPAQKVNRLREAARRAKLDQESSWDKVVIRGRVWADRAHRFTATGLIVASVIATSFAALSFGEMILANRHKKAEWYAQQQAAYDRALKAAKQAELDGTLTSDLALFLNKERAIEQAEEEKKNKGSLWQQAKNTVFGGLKLEEGTPIAPLGDTTLNASQATGGEQSRTMIGEQLPHSREALSVPRNAAEDSRIVESRAKSSGGPLDRMAENAVTSISTSSKSWFGWIQGQ